MARKQTPASAARSDAAPTAPPGIKAAPKAPSSLPPPKAPKAGAIPVEQWDIPSILLRVCEGERIASIADSLGTSMMMLLHQLGRPEYAEAYRMAKEARGHVAVDRIEGIVEGVAKGRIDPSAARVAIEALRWLAGKLNTTYHDKHQVEVSERVDNAAAIRLLSAKPVPALPPMPAQQPADADNARPLVH